MAAAARAAAALAVAAGMSAVLGAGWVSGKLTMRVACAQKMDGSTRCVLSPARAPAVSCIGLRDHPAGCTLHPAPCTLHPAPCTLHPASCTLHPVPCILHRPTGAWRIESCWAADDSTTRPQLMTLQLMTLPLDHNGPDWTAPMHCSTTAPLHRSTAPPLHRSTALPLYRSTAPPINCSTTEPPNAAQLEHRLALH